jgi:rhamnogalacturonyl hydrolase YesR
MNKSGSILGLCLLAALPLLGQSLSPRVVVEAVANRIVASTTLRLDTVRVKEPQERTYFIDFGYLHDPAQRDRVYVAKAEIVWKAKEAPPINLSRVLQYSGDAGWLSMTVRNRYTGKTRSVEAYFQKELQFNRKDYEYIELIGDTELQVQPDSLNRYEMTIEYRPTGYRARLLLAWADPKNYLQVNDLVFSSGTAPAPFRQSLWSHRDSIQWQQPEPPLIHALADDPLGYSDWRYFTGVFNLALLDVHSIFPDLDYQPFVERHTAFFYQNIELVRAERQQNSLRDGLFHQYERFTLLDDFGPQGAVLWRLWKDKSLRKQRRPHQKVLQADAQSIAAALDTEVLKVYNGCYSRITPHPFVVQSDDAMMGGYALVTLYRHTKEKAWLEAAITQSEGFHRSLFDLDDALYYHALLGAIEDSTVYGKRWHNGCHWARGMGWVLLFQTELLSALPQNHPYRTQLQGNLQQVCEGLLRVQASDGRWFNVLNDTTSYLETSATAMFVTAFARGVSAGYLGDAYRVAAERGWAGLCSQIDAVGNVSGIIVGTPILHSAAEYNRQKTRLNDPRGMGAVVWAGLAVEQMRAK